ncbi:MAG: AIR synthase-related protein, partial [Nitrososphaera sp.]
TRIYVDALLPLLQAGLATGVANISGGGFLTISRLNPRVGFEITEVPEPQPIFDLIRVSGNVGPEEMLSTFNMGLGMVIAVAPNNVDRAKQLLTQNGEKATIVGRVVPPKRLGEVIVRPAGVRGVGHEFELM